MLGCVVTDSWRSTDRPNSKQTDRPTEKTDRQTDRTKRFTRQTDVYNTLTEKHIVIQIPIHTYKYQYIHCLLYTSDAADE